MFFDDSEFSMSVKAQKALDFYFQKFGTPPQVLETSIQDEPVPEGLDLVVRVQRVSIPKFHFLIGIEGVK
jgi:hypothetical protein